MPSRKPTQSPTAMPTKYPPTGQPTPGPTGIPTSAPTHGVRDGVNIVAATATGGGVLGLLILFIVLWLMTKSSESSNDKDKKGRDSSRLNALRDAMPRILGRGSFFTKLQYEIFTHHWYVKCLALLCSNSRSCSMFLSAALYILFGCSVSAIFLREPVEEIYFNASSLIAVIGYLIALPLIMIHDYLVNCILLGFTLEADATDEASLGSVEKSIMLSNDLQLDVLRYHLASSSDEARHTFDVAWGVIETVNLDDIPSFLPGVSNEITSDVARAAKMHATDWNLLSAQEDIALSDKSEKILMNLFQTDFLSTTCATIIRSKFHRDYDMRWLNLTPLPGLSSKKMAKWAIYGYLVLAHIATLAAIIYFLLTRHDEWRNQWGFAVILALLIDILLLRVLVVLVLDVMGPIVCSSEVSNIQPAIAIYIDHSSGSTTDNVTTEQPIDSSISYSPSKYLFEDSSLSDNALPPSVPLDAAALLFVSKFVALNIVCQRQLIISNPLLLPVLRATSQFTSVYPKRRYGEPYKAVFSAVAELFFGHYSVAIQEYAVIVFGLVMMVAILFVDIYISSHAAVTAILVALCFMAVTTMIALHWGRDRGHLEDNLNILTLMEFAKKRRSEKKRLSVSKQASIDLDARGRSIVKNESSATDDLAQAAPIVVLSKPSEHHSPSRRSVDANAIVPVTSSIKGSATGRSPVAHANEASSTTDGILTSPSTERDGSSSTGAPSKKYIGHLPPLTSTPHALQIAHQKVTHTSSPISRPRISFKGLPDDIEEETPVKSTYVSVDTAPSENVVDETAPSIPDKDAETSTAVEGKVIDESATNTSESHNDEVSTPVSGHYDAAHDAAFSRRKLFFPSSHRNLLEEQIHRIDSVPTADSDHHLHRDTSNNLGRGELFTPTHRPIHTSDSPTADVVSHSSAGATTAALPMRALAPDVVLLPPLKPVRSHLSVSTLAPEPSAEASRVLDRIAEDSIANMSLSVATTKPSVSSNSSNIATGTASRAAASPPVAGGPSERHALLSMASIEDEGIGFNTSLRSIISQSPTGHKLAIKSPTGRVVLDQPQPQPFSPALGRVESLNVPSSPTEGAMGHAPTSPDGVISINRSSSTQDPIRNAVSFGGSMDAEDTKLKKHILSLF